MPRRPSRCYRYQTRPPYTRREYIRGVPDPKIRIYVMGNKKGNFDVYLTLVSLEKGQVSHNALEAARMTANRYLNKKLSRDNFFLHIRAHPYHVLRENRMMAFAGADRLQEGMRRAFGKPIGTAARVRVGSPLVTIGVNKEHINIAMEALRRVAMKFPMPTRVFVEKGDESIKRKLGLLDISVIRK
ncbi:MAG: 50S ribosomal protein L16 [Candidatus Asgardarchaeia archaeon]